MRDRVVRGGAIAAAGLVLLAAACSSSGSPKVTKRNGGTSTTAGTAGSAGDTLPTVTIPPDATGSSTTTADTPQTDPIGGGVLSTNPTTHVPETTPSGGVITEPPTTTTVPPTTTQAPSTTKPPPQFILQWKLAIDYRTHPQTNPFAQYQGGPRVWSLREGTTRNGNYPLMPLYSSPFGASGVAGWHDATSGCYRTPVIASNTVRAPASVCGANIPSGATWLAPSSSHFAVVAWTSLFDANISISAGVADIDGCGDGVRFYIDKGTESLSAITLTTANALMLQPITTAVSFGTPIYFIVDAGPKGDASCDATQLVVDIERLAS